MKVLIDPRTELLSVIQLLGNYSKKFGLVTENQTAYKTSIIKWFTDGKEHRAVKTSDKMGDAGFSFDAPHNLMLNLSNPPELTLKTPLSDYLLNRGGGREYLDEYISSIREFANEYNFTDFYEQSKNYYNTIIRNYNKYSPKANYKKQMERYYGKVPGNYISILTLLLRGNYGMEFDNDVYSIMGLNGITEFDSSKNDMLQHLIWHELSHPIINPLTAQYKEIMESTEILFEPIKHKMISQAYPSWEICVNEHIIRAITNRLALIHFGEETYNFLNSEDKKKGFIYLKKVIQSLVDYEQNRQEFRTIDSFYKQIMNVFLSIM